MSNPYFTYVPQFFEGTLARGSVVDNEFTRVEAAFDAIDVDTSGVAQDLADFEAYANATFLNETEVEAIVASTVQAGGPPIMVPVAELNVTGLQQYEVVTRLPGQADGSKVSPVSIANALAQSNIAAFIASRPIF